VFEASDLGVYTDTIKDFNAAEGDVIDLSDVVTNFNSGDNINDFVRVVNDGGSAMIQVSTAGNGSGWQDTMLIENQAASQVNVEDLFQNGNIDVT
jgi:ribosomal protein L19